MSLPFYQITGGTRLKGQVRISGSKNASLPIMAAALMCDGEVVLHDVPVVADVKSLCELLTKLGKTPNSTDKWLEQIHDSPARTNFLAGRSDFGDLGVKIPPTTNSTSPSAASATR